MALLCRTVSNALLKSKVTTTTGCSPAPVSHCAGARRMDVVLQYLNYIVSKKWVYDYFWNISVKNELILTIFRIQNAKGNDTRRL